jgi:UrcA family protein
MLKTSFAIAAALLAAALTPAPAAANGTLHSHPAQVRVAYGDLDLASAAGRARLEQRLDTAVRTVCGDASLTDLLGQAAVRQCLRDTRAAIVLPAAALAETGYGASR